MRERPANRAREARWRAALWRRLPRPLADLLSSRRHRVEGASMSPGLRTGDLVLVSQAAYLRAAPERGDIVLVRVPGERREYLKRIVGLPGEEMRVEQGRASLAGQPLQEPYLASLAPTPGHVDGVWVLGEDEYFVLGDNRAESRDSRAFGPVLRAWMEGRAWYRYGPRGRVGPLHNKG